MNFIKNLKIKYYLLIRNFQVSYVFSDIIRYKAPVYNVLLYLFFISFVSTIIFVASDFYKNISIISVENTQKDVSVKKSKKDDLKTNIVNKKFINYKFSLTTPKVHSTFFLQNSYTPTISDSLLKKTERALLVDKENERLFLCYYNKYYDKWLIGRYDGVGYGRVSGQKEAVNDGRSPEGIYFIIDKRKNPLSVLGVYGPRAFVTNYPNHIDRSLNRTGYGIWIHGVELDSGWRSSRGCFTLDNSFIKYIDNFVTEMMPVVIVPKIDRELNKIFDENSLENEKKFAKMDYNFLHNVVIKFIDNWAKAWSSRDIEKYMTFYSKNMYARNMDYDTWKSYKARIFAHNDSIYVSATDITPVEVKNDTIRVEFLQHYWAKNLEQIGMKRFILVKENGKWRIVDEIVIRTIS